MKTLYVHRHAKSDWKSGVVRDHDRPLNSRGHKNAAFMARRFAEEGIDPELLVSSTAKRAMDTMTYYSEALSTSSDGILLDPQVYSEGTEGIITVLNKIPESAETVMIFGHNPTLSNLVSVLDQNSSEYLVTCSRVKIELEIGSWTELFSNTGKVKEHIYPKLFPEMQ